MEVYLYCSYTGSPVGFIMGRIKQEGKEQWTEMSEDNISPAIRACFEYGIIKKAIGEFNALKDGADPQWVVLLKNLIYKEPYSEENFTWYINIAFVTEDKGQYEGWLDAENPIDLASRIAHCLKIDKETRFGYCPDYKSLTEYCSSISLTGHFPQQILKESPDFCCFEFQNNLPAEKREAFISEHIEKKNKFQLCSPENLHNWSICEKKKIALGNGMIAIITILLLLCLTVISILVFNKGRMEEGRSLTWSEERSHQFLSMKKTKPLLKH